MPRAPKSPLAYSHPGAVIVSVGLYILTMSKAHPLRRSSVRKRNVINYNDNANDELSDEDAHVPSVKKKKEAVNNSDEDDFIIGDEDADDEGKEKENEQQQQQLPKGKKTGGWYRKRVAQKPHVEVIAVVIKARGLDPTKSMLRKSIMDEFKIEHLEFQEQPNTWFNNVWCGAAA